MKYYAVIDTNVLVSSLLTKNDNSPVVKIINAIRNSTIIPMFNADILAEYVEVLSRDRLGLNQDVVSETLAMIKSRGIDSEMKPVSENIPDPDDVVFYEIAMSREDSYLVTGNLKHFPRNGKVVSPSEMLMIMEFGQLSTGLLNHVEPPLYMPMSLDEINDLIKEVRRQVRLQRDNYINRYYALTVRPVWEE